MKEEISLREIIEIVMKQKWIIIIVTISCMLISALVSLFILNPTYETYSIVRMQSASNEENQEASDITIFEESLKSSSTLNSLIEKNQLDRNTYTINSIREMFKLEVIPETNTMKIIVKGNDPEQASQMANMLAFELGVRIEITDRTKEIVASQKRLEELADEIAIAKVKLLEAQEQLKITPEKQVTKQVLADNDLLRSVVQDQINTDVVDTIAIEMESEMINPVYTELQSKVAQATIELNTLQKEEENQKQKIDMNQSRINEIELKSSNDKLESNKSIRILDGTNAIFISPSIQPEKPVSPNVVLNVAVAAVLGGMLSLLIVFLRQYLKGTPGSEVNV